MSWLYHMNGPADAATFQWNICSINRSCPDWKSDTQTHIHTAKESLQFTKWMKMNVYWFLWFLILNKTPLLKETIIETIVYDEFPLWEAIFTKSLFLSINWSRSYLGHACSQPTPPNYSLFLWKATVTLCWSMKAGSGPSSHSITLNIQQRLHNIGKLFTSQKHIYKHDLNLWNTRMMCSFPWTYFILIWDFCIIRF